MITLKGIRIWKFGKITLLISQKLGKLGQKIQSLAEKPFDKETTDGIHSWDISNLNRTENKLGYTSRATAN